MEIFLIMMLVGTHLAAGTFFYWYGRKQEKVKSDVLYKRITSLQIEKGKIERELASANIKILNLEQCNELIYEEGKRDQIKNTVKEMITEHDQNSFKKIPQKKSLNEGGTTNDDANYILYSRSGIHIYLDSPQRS